MAEWLGRGLQNLLQRFEPAPDLRIRTCKQKDMGVTRLKRKDRRNKTVSRLEVQFLKIGRNLETGSRSKQNVKSQVSINNMILGQLETSIKSK